MDATHTTIIKDTTGNPASLGLFGFGITTVFLNVHNAGLIGMSSMILAMGIFVGGLAQVPQFGNRLEVAKIANFNVQFIAHGN